MTDKAMETLRNEFTAMERLYLAWNSLRSTAVVDDDYPQMRHYYESALRDFIDALRANQRFTDEKKPVFDAASYEQARDIIRTRSQEKFEGTIGIMQTAMAEFALEMFDAGMTELKVSK